MMMPMHDKASPHCPRQRVPAPRCRPGGSTAPHASPGCPPAASPAHRNPPARSMSCRANEPRRRCARGASRGPCHARPRAMHCGPAAGAGAGGSHTRGRNVPPSPAMRTPSMSVTRAFSDCAPVIGLRAARGQVPPHLRAAVVVVVAEDPVHRDTPVQQRRGQHVQWLFALHIAQDDRGRRCFGQLRQGRARPRPIADGCRR